MTSRPFMHNDINQIHEYKIQSIYKLINDTYVECGAIYLNVDYKCT